MTDFDIDPLTGSPIPKSPSPTSDFTPAPNAEVGKPIDTLINLAKKANEELKKEEPTIKEVLNDALELITIGERLMSKKPEILAIFRNHGMDSMSVIKAWDELMSVLSLEK